MKDIDFIFRVRVYWLLLSLSFGMAAGFGQSAPEKEYFDWQVLTELPPFGRQEEALGVAGPVAGRSNEVLIIAGGANFTRPYWESDKEWHDDIWILDEKEESDRRWRKAGTLPHPLAYAAVVSTPVGVLAMGGNNGQQVYEEVLLLRWDPDQEKVLIEQLPPLRNPVPTEVQP